MSLIALSRLLHDGPPDQSVVALRRGQALDFGQFRAAAAAVEPNYTVILGSHRNS